MYIDRFVRKDGKPDEEYYYHRLEDAQKHVDLFKDDDSELFEKIEIVTLICLSPRIIYEQKCYSG